MGEHYVDIVGVAGSIPAASTILLLENQRVSGNANSAVRGSGKARHQIDTRATGNQVPARKGASSCNGARPCPRGIPPGGRGCPALGPFCLTSTSLLPSLTRAISKLGAARYLAGATAAFLAVRTDA